MRASALLALGLSAVVGGAQPQPNSLPSVVQSEADTPLSTLIQETLNQNPDLAAKTALVEAEQERIPQARALPDPSLALGLQNDGFKKLQIGMMETSYYQVMVTQPLPWPGKRGLRGEIASLEVDSARWARERTRLSLVAEVKRAYIGLLLVRGQMALLTQQALFWQKAGEITKVRYEVGQGTQADLLRAQLEQIRLRQTRISLQSEEKVYLATLNRLRGGSPEAPVRTLARLEDLPLPSAENWAARAAEESPEVQAARLGTRQAERNLDLAKRDRYPDLALSAGLMPRGSLDPMWQVGISVSLPIWSNQKQHRAVAEQELRRRAQGSETSSVQNLLHQRIQERSAQLDAALEIVQLYREGLLVQSEASFQANLAQYEAGRGAFLSVLEALNGWLADQGSYLQALAQAQAIQIAQQEFNLTGTPPISAQALSASAMGMGSSPGGTAKAGPAPAKGSESSPSMKAM
ncbi:MAG: TolC family protein [Holophaga sp.]